MRTLSKTVLAELDAAKRVRDLVGLAGRVPGNVVMVSDLPDGVCVRVEDLGHPDVAAVDFDGQSAREGE